MVKKIFILTSENYTCTENSLDCFHCLVQALLLQKDVFIYSNSKCELLSKKGNIIHVKNLIYIKDILDLIIILYTNFPTSSNCLSIKDEPFLNHLHRVNKPDKTIYIDYFEQSWMNKYNPSEPLYHIFLQFYCHKYFKREHYKEISFENMLPIPLTYFPKNLLSTQDKIYDVFCSFPSTATGLRKNAISVCKRLIDKGYNIIIKNTCSKEEYIENIRKSYITLDAKGAGHVNNRFFEIISNRSVCFREKYPCNFIFYKDYISGEEIIEYDTEKDLYDKIVFYLNDKEKLKKIEENAYNHYNSYHTSEKIGKYILDNSV